ncbi:hypothetical protein GT037_009587 [Alternaria burnsii]|uniref:Uncharacterized protein n=1 Tax=Alternaria burnsii TaxID=1187904 RepID=A0A8H7ECH4_9PLEO|nr:uncharacterized protein GT037_009587 [Alternaria burnsii]KAF7672556.1 hypothetical protein GT037_009587 [Alternaria burnsii]
MTKQTPNPTSRFVLTMRYLTPIIALAASLAHLTTAQLGSHDTICRFLYGTEYTDACCHTVISRGLNAPCTDIEDYTFARIMTAARKETGVQVECRMAFATPSTYVSAL